MSERKEKVGKCCKQFWRWTFLVLNVLILLIGLGVFATGIYLLASQNNLDFLTGSQYASGGVLILIAGFITVVISLIGVVAAAGMWPVLFIIYIICMVVIVVLEIVAGILGFVYQEAVARGAAERARVAINLYRDRQANQGDFRADVNAIVEFMQEQFDCCGYLSYFDWNDTVYYNNSGGLFPPSCTCPNTTNITRCIPVTQPLRFAGSGSGSTPDLTTQFIWTQSCNASVLQFLDRYLAVVAAVGTAFGVFEIVGIAMAIGLTVCACLARRNKEDFDFTKHKGRKKKGDDFEFSNTR